MADNYAKLAFGEESKKLQEKFGSRSTYARMEEMTIYDGLTLNEGAFIAERDSFYMASIGENGYPYIQHRGGPVGFLKVIDSKTLALPDFRGNKQYITVGNVATNHKVALILMDYPHRTRLKIYANVEIIELGKDLALEKKLELNDYPGKPERIIKLNVEVYDWNCPQHITPRFTLEEIETVLAPQREFVDKLIEENKQLKEALKLKNDSK